MFSPIPRAGINLKKDFELIGRNRNRIKSAREFEWSNEDILFNKNYRILYEYLMQWLFSFFNYFLFLYFYIIKILLLRKK